MYNKIMIRFGFCDIQNNQGLGEGYQPQPSADNPYFDLDYSGYHKNLIHLLFITCLKCTVNKCVLTLGLKASVKV